MRITDAALVAAAVLSDRYITARFLPDKAIDLVDEAASRLRIEIDSMPEEIDELKRRIIQLEIEEAAARRSPTAPRIERLESLEKELADLEEEVQRLEAHWNHGERGDHRHPRHQGADRAGQGRGGARRA